MTDSNQPILTMNQEGREFFRLMPDGTIECAPEDYEAALIQVCKVFVDAATPAVGDDCGDRMGVSFGELLRRSKRPLGRIVGGYNNWAHPATPAG